VPTYYSHDRSGTGRDYQEEVHFDSARGVIRSRFRDETVEFDYDRDVVDGLTVQLQLMLDLQKGNRHPRYKILDENEIREREFRFIGEDMITIQNEECHTLVYELVRANDRRTTRLWFSTERDFLPVQMVHFSKGKKRFNAHLVDYDEVTEAVNRE
jgi:hypothetical protein